MVMVHFFGPCGVFPDAGGSSGPRILHDAAREILSGRYMLRRAAPERKIGWAGRAAVAIHTDKS
jgi:hypothetical protein